jgi:DNA-binding transcriptional ArsR family regulator
MAHPIAFGSIEEQHLVRLSDGLVPSQVPRVDAAVRDHKFRSVRAFLVDRVSAAAPATHVSNRDSGRPTMPLAGCQTHPRRWKYFLVSSCAKCLALILSLMEQYSQQLSGIFQALADPTRRAVLGRLGKGPASISELARPFDMALPSFMKHIRFLESSGLVRTRKNGRVRTCAIDRKQFDAAEAWFSEQRALWESRADRLEQFVINIQEKEKTK